MLQFLSKDWQAIRGKGTHHQRIFSTIWSFSSQSDFWLFPWIFFFQWYRQAVVHKSILAASSWWSSFWPKTSPSRLSPTISWCRGSLCRRMDRLSLEHSKLQRHYHSKHLCRQRLKQSCHQPPSQSQYWSHLQYECQVLRVKRIYLGDSSLRFWPLWLGFWSGFVKRT